MLYTRNKYNVVNQLHYNFFLNCSPKKYTRNIQMWGYISKSKRSKTLNSNLLGS